MLKQASELLIDVHGQHQHQSLLNPARHMALLDVFCGERLESLEAELDDIIHDIRSYYDDIELDPRRLNQVEKRLNLIYSLKRKYGADEQEILAKYDSLVSQLELINNSEQLLQRLAAERDDLIQKMTLLCDEMTAMRTESANTICEQIEVVLNDLGMKHARFDIHLSKRNEFSPFGRDKVEFLISPNPGEDLKPLAKIASGGEMSRVMLALKTVLADSDNIETFIFDEIDTGVSGRTAQMVAEKLASIAGNHQIICITHLPQIAAMADSHFLIEKSSSELRTTTNVYTLNDGDESVNEIARLLGGAQITTSTTEAAREMKAMAQLIKQKLVQDLGETFSRKSFPKPLQKALIKPLQKALIFSRTVHH